MSEYKCPYCGTNEYSLSYQKRNKVKHFLNWEAVRKHTSTCDKCNGLFYIDTLYGPISHDLFQNKSEFKKLFPNVNASKINNSFKGRKLQVSYSPIEFIYSIDQEKDVILAIQSFYKEFGRLPVRREFISSNGKYPSENVVKKLFGSWNKGLEAAGFSIKLNSGFGIATIAKDGKEYRSKLEAYFVDTYLFGKYTYEYEIRYDKITYRTCDFYIHELNKYIELDGLNGSLEIRSNREESIAKKIKDNPDKDLIILTYDEVYNKKYMKSIGFDL